MKIIGAEICNDTRVVFFFVTLDGSINLSENYVEAFHFIMTIGGLSQSVLKLGYTLKWITVFEKF